MLLIKEHLLTLNVACPKKSKTLLCDIADTLYTISYSIMVSK
jgi:hypothetical protein